MGPAINRRRHERFALPPMYTPISVLATGGPAFEGHTYDISEGGAQFELDRAIAPGSAVVAEITLPLSACPGESAEEPQRRVRVAGNVVWLDESEPGPVRMAIAFTRFEREGDRERLLERLARRRLSRAA